MKAEHVVYAALFADWEGRRLAPAASRAARSLPSQFGIADAIRRLRAVGYGQAADLLGDGTLLDEAQRLIEKRYLSGWQPLLPHEQPPGLRERGCGAPPLLWAYGFNHRLLLPAVGIVGSRILTPHEARFAAQAGETCANLGITVFSGGASGADSFGAIGAARSKGAAAHFLPGGCREPFGPVALFSTDPDAAAFDRIDALTRNKWIYAASECTLVVASRFGEGGSWAGAISAMKSRLGRILVYMSPQPSAGNEALAKLGAESVRSIHELRSALGHAVQPKLAV